MRSQLVDCKVAQESQVANSDRISLGSVFTLHCDIGKTALLQTQINFSGNTDEKNVI